MTDGEELSTGKKWMLRARRTVREFLNDQCIDTAAALTYFAVLSLFPMVIATFSLLGLLGQRGEAAGIVIDIVDQLAPDTADALRGPIEQLAQAPGAGIAFVAGIVVALWSASGYVGAFARAMNRVYGVEEGRPFWKLRPLQLLITVIGVAALTIVAIMLIVSGDVARVIGEAIGASEVLQTTWNIAKWPVVVVIVILLVALLYWAMPNVEQPRFRWLSPGAILAIVVLGLGSVGFGVYVQNFSSYDRTYGSLAGVIVFLLWLWLANLALLFGAEFDVELERWRELEVGVPAEKRLRLPLRDDRQIIKRQEALKKDAAEDRKIRTEAD